MAVIVVAAFRASGGLKAGTPLAIASTPVSATEPLAKARRRSRRARGSSPKCSAFDCGATGWTLPVSMLKPPIPTIPSARATKT